MLDLHALKTQDLKALSPAALAELASRMLAHIKVQSLHIDSLDKRAISQAQAIKWRDAKMRKHPVPAGSAEGLAVRRQDRAHER